MVGAISLQVSTRAVVLNTDRVHSYTSIGEWVCAVARSRTGYEYTVRRLRPHSWRKVAVGMKQASPLVILLAVSVSLAPACENTGSAPITPPLGLGMGGALNDGGVVPSAPVCPVGQVLCGSECVSLESNNSHCGQCNNACTGRSLCVNGQCACETGYQLCGNLCANLQTDPNNCGACGQVCVAPQVCSLGGCSDSCAANLTQCGQSCVDLQSTMSTVGSATKRASLDSHALGAQATAPSA